MANLSLTDITSASSGSDSAATSDDSEQEALDAIFEEIGADIDRVQEFMSARDSDDREWITRLAERLADDPEAGELMETYRQLVDFHRLNLNFIRGQREGPFVQAWSDQLYYGLDDDGNARKDDPASGSKNGVQARVNDDDDLNLPLYKAMFPEPNEEYRDENSVCLTEGVGKWSDIGLPGEDGVQDSHIWVPESYVEDYLDYANDDGIPLPPAEFPDAEGAGSGGSTAAAPVQAGELSPGDFTVPELEDELENIDSVRHLSRILALEEDNGDRKTAIEAIESRISEVA